MAYDDDSQKDCNAFATTLKLPCLQTRGQVMTHTHIGTEPQNMDLNLF